MTYSANTTPPSSLVAGDTAQWRITLPDFSAVDGWTLNYRFVGLSTNYSKSSTADGEVFVLNFAAADTAAWVAGNYQLIGYVTGGASERYTVSDTIITIEPNLAALTTGLDLRSSAEKALAAVNLALEQYGNKAYTKQYSIAGRQMVFNSPAEFMAFRQQLMQEVAREKATKDGFGKYLVRF